MIFGGIGFLNFLKSIDIPKKYMSIVSDLNGVDLQIICKKSSRYETYEERRSYLRPLALISLALFSLYFSLSYLFNQTIASETWSLIIGAMLLNQSSFVLTFYLTRKFVSNPAMGIPSLMTGFSSLILLASPNLNGIHSELWLIFTIYALLYSNFIAANRCNLIISTFNLVSPIIVAQYLTHTTPLLVFKQFIPIYTIFGLTLYYGFKNNSFKKFVIDQFHEAEGIRRELSDLMKAINDYGCVLHLDPKGKVIFANAKFLELTGYTNNQIKEYSIDEFTTNEFKKNFWNNKFKITSSGVPWTGEVSFNSSEDKVIWYNLTLSVEHDDEGHILGFLVLFYDISEQKYVQDALKREQEVLAHTAKLASIGELAAGVGHEINNPLAIANGQMRILQRILEEQNVTDERINDCIAHYNEATTRIKNIVSGLRSFARIDTDEVRVLNVNKVIKSSIDLIKEIYSKDQVIMTFEESDLPHYVEGNEGKIQQVLMNLFSNAKDALLDQNDDKFIKVWTEVDHDKVCIHVMDNGCGIKEDVQSDIFNAFFTTKPLGVGTGIGLSLSQRIMEEHNGKISFESSSNGTTFNLILPIVDYNELEDDENEDSLDEALMNKIDNKLRVLIIEDEVGIRQMLKFLLINELGFSVVEAGNGREGLDILKNDKNFDVIITDLKMPIMGGVEFLSEVRKLSYPINQIPVIASSGGTNENIGEGFLYILDKPFDDDEFIQLMEGIRLGINNAA